MRQPNLRSLLVAVIATLVIPVYALQKTAPASAAPVPVTVPVKITNTPLPVTVTTPLPVTVTNPTINSNVTVINPANNPVKTIDAFARMPVTIVFNGAPFCGPHCVDFYMVPADKMLVVETVALLTKCTGVTESEAVTAGLIAAVPHGAVQATVTAFIPLQLQGNPRVGVVKYVGGLNGRMVYPATSAKLQTDAPRRLFDGVA